MGLDRLCKDIDDLLPVHGTMDAVPPASSSKFIRTHSILRYILGESCQIVPCPCERFGVEA